MEIGSPYGILWCVWQKFFEIYQDQAREWRTLLFCVDCFKSYITTNIDVEFRTIRKFDTETIFRNAPAKGFGIGVIQCYADISLNPNLGGR